MVAAAMMLAMVAGCSSKQSGAGAGAGGPGGSGGIGENGLGPNGSSSLNRFQKGTLDANGQGPLSDIHFDYNDYSVRAQDGEVLKSNADWITKNSGSRVQIEGHCDDRGSEEYNIALGAKRAQAAANPPAWPKSIIERQDSYWRSEAAMAEGNPVLALERGEKVVSVTGRVEGWKGNLTQFSKALPSGPRRLLVKDFQIAKP
jgi:hypothetical protein